MKKVLCFFGFVILLGSGNLVAQPLLTLEQAMELAIANDQELQQIRQRIQIATINNHKGTAGLLPSVNFDGTARYGISNVNINFINGENQSNTGATNLSTSASVNATLPIYHGQEGQYRLQQLQLLVEEVSIEERKAIHELEYAVIRAYHAISFQERLMRISLENIEYLQSLKLLAEQKLKLGRGTQLEINQTTADLNREQANILSIELELQLAKSRLNEVLERDAFIDFLVDTNAIQHQNLKLPQLLKAGQENSYDLRLAEQEIAFQEVAQRISKAQQGPRIDAFGGVDFAYSKSGAGFVESNRSYGPHVGLRFSLPIYDGGRLSRANEIAQLNTLLARTQKQIIVTDLSQSLQQQFQYYTSSRKMLLLEERNVQLSTENFQLARQMYQNGRISFYDFRQTRQQLILNRIAQLRIDMQLLQHEIELAYLAGIRRFGK